MKNKITIFRVVLVVILAISSIFFLGFKIMNNYVPTEKYAVYFDGKKIGVVKSKDALNEYINGQEEKLKEKYNVSKIYTPKGVEIKKIVTYDNSYSDEAEIYNRLVSYNNFTIKGVVLQIHKKIENSNVEEDIIDKEEDTEIITINLLNKGLFDEAITSIIKVFLDDDEYDKFMMSEQEEIVETGEIIEDIYIQEEITYRDDYISADELIFTNADDLARYLLYGTTEKQKSYTVKAGDTIETVSSANKMNVQEFLIANPIFTSKNNLLYESQEVVVDTIDPLINVVIEKHSVQDEVRKFSTDVKYDNELVIGYSYVERDGENGVDRVTRKYQYINGQVSDVALISNTELVPAISKILVKGDKYIPNVADLSYWAWPTKKPYYITTYFEWRWGEFHKAIDIAVGFGSPIYAANNGTVIDTSSKCIRGDTSCNGGRGNFIIINHNISNYYTQYMHLNTVLVKPGQTVSRGQLIGTMGNTGHVVPTPPYNSNSYAGTHLDFGVWKGVPYAGGTAINPFNLY